MWGSPKQSRTVWNTHPNRSLRCLLFDFSLITIVDPQRFWPDFSKSEQTDQEPNFFKRLSCVFGHAAPVFFDRGIAKQETGEISSLSVEPCQGETLIITVFEINKSEILDV
ncbi:hypothetical protein MRB53_024930 [Persea americana]|uniref:Uncharacterized protein n=1 Tax=Persea americana TaxID=3435 RepID=A0ACC2LEP9_PERAE|nr:hypothetical protein MRB53_024930 [Persea americana]